MDTSKISEAVGKVADIIAPYSLDEQMRIVRAAITVVGGDAAALSSASSSANAQGAQFGTDLPADLPPKAKMWINQHHLSMTDLEQVYHLEGGHADLIAAHLPGKGKKAQTINTYVLLGVGRLLSTGNTEFDDKTARETCRSHGCYDEANHALTMKEVGNRITGSKEKGWKLTTPGLAYGATLIREIVQGEKP